MRQIFFSAKNSSFSVPNDTGPQVGGPTKKKIIKKLSLRRLSVIFWARAKV